SYAVTTAIADAGGSTATATSTATVWGGRLAGDGGRARCREGASTDTVTVATFTDANPNAAPNEFTATIAWGDGTTSAGTIAAQPGGGFIITGAHSYAQEGSYAVTTAIADAGGSTATATSTATVSGGRLAG